MFCIYLNEQCLYIQGYLHCLWLASHTRAESVTRLQGGKTEWNRLHCEVSMSCLLDYWAAYLASQRRWGVSPGFIYLPQWGICPPSLLAQSAGSWYSGQWCRVWLPYCLISFWLHLKKAKCSAALAFSGRLNRLSLHSGDVQADMRAMD